MRPRVYVYDMGQNLVGVPRITHRQRARGRDDHAAVLRDALSRPAGVGQERRDDHDGELPGGAEPGRLHDEGRAARCSSRASRRTAIQYVEITGIDQPLPLAAVQGVAISSVRSLTADYKTSSEKVNRLWSNLVWSNVDNFLTIPTDCPQRNERMGWSGDINVFSRTATYVSNANQFLTRHMYAMRDVQTPAGRFTDVAPVGGGFGGVLWGSAGIVVPWETYLQYKDVGLLERHYPAMAAYMAYLETTIDPKTGLSSDGQLGDWLGPQNNALGSAFLVTAYHAYDLGIMAKVAELLGKPADAAKYREQYEKRKAYFNATFVNAEKKTLATGGGRGGGRGAAPAGPPEFRVADTQTSYAVRPGHGAVQRREHAADGQEPRRRRRAREQGRRRRRAAEVLADDRVHRHGVDQQGAVARTATASWRTGCCTTTSTRPGSTPSTRARPRSGSASTATRSRTGSAATTA